MGGFGTAETYLGDAFQARGDGSTVVGISGRALGFYGSIPIVKPTTSIAGATLVVNTGTAINSASTFDGYTIAQVVNSLKQLGLLT